MAEQQTFTLPAGAVCHRNGIPFKLQHATQIECHPDNWPLIKGDPSDALESETFEPKSPLAPAGAAELVPLTVRLIELLEVAAMPAIVTYSFAGETPSSFAAQAFPAPERELEV